MKMSIYTSLLKKNHSDNCYICPHNLNHIKNLHMKTKLILFSLVTILFTTCTIDETDSGNAQFSETEKTKLYQLANKYGVKFRIRDKEKFPSKSFNERGRRIH